MPIVFILLGVGVVLGFLVVAGIAVFLTRDKEDAEDDSEPYL